MGVAEVETIELNNVGPIRYLPIPIPSEGGLVVLKGPNGSGKTHGINATAALYDKGARKALTNSDNVPSGSIVGKGVTVRLGRSNTARGELECESLDGRVDPSQLVDPGIKDPEKADAKRLAALVRLSGIRIPIAKWESLVVGLSDASVAGLDSDPVLAADRLRRDLHAIALKLEKSSDEKGKRGVTLLASVESVPVESASADELSAAYDSASEALAKATAKNEAYSDALRQFESAKSRLDSLPPIDVEECKSNLDISTESVNQIRHKIYQLSAELDQLKKKQGEANAKCAIDKTRLESAIERNDSRNELIAIINAGTPEKISDSEIESLENARQAAREAIQNGEVVRRAISTRNEAATLAEESESLRIEAVRYRDIARSTDVVLEEALVEAGFGSIKVHDGRLCIESDRGLEPFSELSHGERWRMALDFAAQGLPEGAILPVAQEAYESLDPTNRQEIASLARERKLVIVTALAAGGELRAEVVEGGAA